MPSAAPLAPQRAPQATRPALHGILQRCGPEPCNCPDREDGGPLRRAAVAPSPVEGQCVPPIVYDVLRSPGQPLAVDVRAFYESRFGHDFSTVRLHADSKAAESARAVNAQAYTVGTDIVLGAAAHTATAAQGSGLLAHELAHVVQQDDRSAHAAAYSVEPAGSPVEAEAARSAADVTAGRLPHIRTRGARLARQTLCADMLLEPGAEVDGDAVDVELRRHFVDATRPNAWLGAKGTTMHQIQDATYAARRTQGYGSRQSTRVKPFVGGDPGTPDLAYKAGRRVELAELKPAEHTALADGIDQVLNYVEHGNSEENRSWRRGLGLAASDAFSLMLPTRYMPPSQLTVNTRRVEFSWCTPGVLVYRALTPEETETIICGYSDQKEIDKFLNSALDKAQGAVDQFIDTSVDKLITQKIRTLSIRDGLRLLARYGRKPLRDLLNQQLGPGSGVLVGLLTDDQLVDEAAVWLEKQLGPELEALLRRIVLQIKTKLLNDVRQQIKERLRSYLQESLTAVCTLAAVGATVSVAQLLKKLKRDMGRLVGEAVVEVLEAWAIDALKELAKALLIALVAAVAIVIVIVLLPEILAALAAAAALVATVGAALAALVPRLLPLIHKLLEAASLTPALQGAG